MATKSSWSRVFVDGKGATIEVSVELDTEALDDYVMRVLAAKARDSRALRATALGGAISVTVVCDDGRKV